MGIDAQAADWATRIDLGPLSEADRARFDAWVGADVLHRGAYARAAAILNYAKRAKALGEDYDPAAFRDQGAAGDADDTVVTPIELARPRIGRRTFLAGAGSMAAAGAAFVFGYDMLFRSTVYRTATGEMQRVFLDDGSVLTLNTASQAKVTFSKEKRLIELIEGEALFDVAKDASRPFVVSAGPTDVTAIGTSFTVRKLAGASVNVLVREGVVTVGDRARGVGARPIVAKANMKVVAPAGTTPEVTKLDEYQVAQQLAWESGMLSFEAMPLAAAAAEFRRYSATEIEVPDSDIAGQPVTGRFAANDPEGFAAAVATSLGVRSHKSDGRVVISR